MAGVEAARSRAMAVLRVRGAALGAALLPAAVAVVLLAARATGHGGWGWVAWAVTGCAVAVLLLAAAFSAVLTRARPAQSPTVPVDERSAPELYRLVRDLAGRLKVPAPSAIALTPDCDSWLEFPPAAGHPAASAGPGAAPAAPRRGIRPPLPSHRAEPPAPVLVIGSPFLWWMRVAELRALLAPVVAGTGPAADDEVAAARRFVRGLDAAVAVAEQAGAARAPRWTAPVRRPALACLGWVSRSLLRACRGHAVEMERAVAAWAAAHAQQVDYGLRIVAQEQVGLAYAGWDRLLTRVALPAWRMGRWPARLDAGVVAALTELSRRDRLAEGFESRLGERPACDLLEEPGTVDEAVSLLAARLFHGGPAVPGPGWAPVAWDEYPEQVVDRIWRTAAARLHRVLDELAPPAADDARATVARVLDRLADGGGDDLAVRLMALAEREDAERAAARSALPGAPGEEPLPPVYELLPPRTARDLLIEHVTAMVCCAAVDTAGARPGLDWLDGPVLLAAGHRCPDLTRPVAHLIEQGEAAPLRAWLSQADVRPEKPVRLV
jgi:hypothetical protein